MDIDRRNLLAGLATSVVAALGMPRSSERSQGAEELTLLRHCPCLDTWASNDALVAHYERQGFRVVDHLRIGVDDRLPSHCHGNEYVLLEEPDQ